MFNMLQKINENLLIYLNSFSKNEFIANMVWIFADLPIFFIPLFLVIAWFYYAYKKNNEEKINLILIFYSCFIWVLIALLIQQIIHFDRPENYIEWTWNLLLKHIPDASFPSDHATVGFAFLVSLFFTWYKKIFWIYLPFVILMWLSRVIAWIHWPFDIIAWLIIWIIASIITFYYIKKLEIIKKLNKLILKFASFLKL